MSIHIFGRGDDIVFSHMYSIGTSLGGEVSYTDPSHEWFYSKYGFAIPTNHEAVPYHVVMDHTFPVMSDKIKRHDAPYQYILIDHAGQIWNVITSKDDSDGPTFNYTYIYHSNISWWLNRTVLDIGNEDNEFLLGLLASNPDKKTIDKAFIAHQGGKKLTWLKLSEIVKKLNEEYPVPTASDSEDKFQENKQEIEKLIEAASDLILD